MIIFKSIKYKNFLSTGNSFTEIDFTKSKTTLVVGQNGAGKSTMLDALSFALFGKPHRNIQKKQIINSINRKDCVVEAEFSIGSSTYRVVRGINPNLFEIWKSGTLINQSSHAKDYQKILEQNILKLNHKSFHQVVVLGSSSFIPFMQLSNTDRKFVIEDLLDINVFSKMNVLLKEKQSTLKNELNELTNKIEIIKAKIDTQNKYIKDVQILTEQNIKSKENTKKNKQTEVETLQDENIKLSETIETKLPELQDELQKLQDKRQTLLSYTHQFKTQMKTLAKDTKFYEENEQCPTCSQDISQELRDEKINNAKDKAKEFQTAYDNATEQEKSVGDTIEGVNVHLTEMRNNQSTINSNNKMIKTLQKEITEIDNDLSSTAIADLKQARTDLDTLNKDKDKTTEDKLNVFDMYSYNQVIGELLKDTGIKTKIIKQYLPVINKLTNQYLQVLDFFVHFDLDESFKETIRSRHRDDFSYDSFSEGEKQRIDLSLLFTWRQIAKMKNSVSTNLLILDETFDSSLDYDGVENLFKILHTLPDDSNIFVISHKGDILDGKFDDKIEFHKEKNFSKIKTYLQSEQ